LQCLPLLRGLLRCISGHDTTPGVFQADIHYLANLCHNCGACLHACQYAAPHEFEINVPKAMAKVRLDTYAEYAWPQVMGTLYRRNGLTLALSAGTGLALFLCLTLMVMGNLFTAMPGEISTGSSRTTPWP
jgi:citrate/tricarballylate utilization protein